MSALMRFASLGSGSEGNALLVQCGQTVVLMDCGFNLSGTLARISRLGLKPDDISGIVVTHEHGDHVAGVGRLAKKYSLPVWLTHGTLHAQFKSLGGLAQLNEINPHASFAIGELQIQCRLM